MGILSPLKIIFPVVLAVLWSPLPRKYGLYEFYLHSDDRWLGMLPCSFRSEESWGFTFDDLYGDGPDQTSIKSYRERLWGQTALVTGANSGVGFEVAMALHRLGASVTLACRNPAKCDAAAQRIREDPLVQKRGNPGAVVTTGKVDTSSLRSVQTFCRSFLGENRSGPLDMIFFNAGIGSDGFNIDLTEDGIEKVFATNVVGHHLMYRLLEPIIFHPSRQTPARIVLTSSTSSFRSPYSYKVPTDLETLNTGSIVARGLYEQSKLAQVLWAKELTARLDTKDNDKINNDPNQIVYVNSAHPGMVATNIWNNIISEGTNTLRKKLVRGVFAVFKWIMMDSMWTCEEGALTLVYLGTAIQQLQENKIRGQYFHPQTKWIKDHRAISDKDPTTRVLQTKLWNFLDELVVKYV